MSNIFLPKFIHRSQVHLVLRYKKVSLILASLFGGFAVVISRFWLLPYVDGALLSQGKDRPLSMEFFISTSMWITGLLIAFAVAVWGSRGEELSFEKRLSKIGSTKQISTSHLVGPTHGFKIYSIIGFIIVYLFLSLFIPLLA